MHIRKKSFVGFVYLYIGLPVFLFFALYMSSVIGIFLATIFAVVSYMVTKQTKIGRESLTIPISIFVLFVVVAIVWTFLGGQGNHYYQSNDWDCRNAIFRDLIYKDWPVIYPEKNSALVYYIGDWLPAGLLVKLIGKNCPIIFESELAFDLGCQFLWIWNIIGIILVQMLIYLIVAPKKRSYAMLIPVALVFFSGLDIIGVVLRVLSEQKSFGMHIEWWADGMQFSSCTTCLFWVFNQTIVPWIVILLLFLINDKKNYVWLGVCSLMSGPLPFIGIMFYMVGLALVGFVKSITDSEKRKKLWDWFQELVSLRNIVSLIFVYVIYLYYSSNMAVNGVGIGVAEDLGTPLFGGLFNVIPFTDDYFFRALSFLILEVYIYLIFLFRFYYKNPFFYITFIICSLCPFFSIGLARDFCMRVSIPSIMVLLVVCCKCLFGEDRESANSKKYKCWLSKPTCKCIIVILMIIGAITPLTEFSRGYEAMLSNGKIDNTCDNIVSFERIESAEEIANFVTNDYSEKVFFKYLTGNGG